MEATGRAAVVDDVRAQLAAVSADAVDAVRRTVPAYRYLHAAQLREAESIAGWVVTAVLDVWSGRRAPALPEQVWRTFRGIGAARATDGRPLTAVLRAYRIAAVSVVASVRRIGGDRVGVDDVVDVAGGERLGRGHGPRPPGRPAAPAARRPRRSTRRSPTGGGTVVSSRAAP